MSRTSGTYALLQKYQGAVRTEEKARAARVSLYAAAVRSAQAEIAEAAEGFNRERGRTLEFEQIAFEAAYGFFTVTIGFIRDRQTREELKSPAGSDDRPLTPEQAEAACAEFRAYLASKLRWLNGIDKLAFKLRDTYVIGAGLTFGWDEQW